MDESFIFNKNSYVAFDGTSLRDIIVDRLNRGQVFTDQNYQGSNISAVIDIISYSFSNLLFYLNKTSSESLFSESQLYENMNRIVKLLNYKPVGPQGQTVPVKLSVTNLPKGNYIIPKYSYINVGSTTYSFNEDVSFSKLTDSLVEDITILDNKITLREGFFQEYPLYTSGGIDNEKIYLSVDSKVTVDNFNIFVYIKKYNTDTWQKWTRVQDLFLNKATDTIYEVRYNENKRYELTFGDDINGKKLEKGDSVAIYYLKINPNIQNIGVGAMNIIPTILYNSIQFTKILSDTGIDSGNYLNSNGCLNVKISNDFPSTSYSPEETVDDIRKNAPQNFKSQNRLVTGLDYEIFIKSNYKNLISDIKLLNNDEYLKQHIKYLYDNGLKNPQEDTKILYNQIKFANSCNFNNLYIYMIPSNQGQEYLTPSQKEFILEGLKEVKTITTQIIPIDPVYVYMDFYLKKYDDTAININDISQTKILINKSFNTRRASSAIALEIKKIFDDSFSRETSKLGQIIDIYQIANKIINIDGVDSIQTYRSDINLTIDGLSFVVWNPTYPETDVNVFTQNLTIENFKFPIFNNIENILDRIEIVEKSNSIKIADF
jgi:hypothetical protein